MSVVRREVGEAAALDLQVLAVATGVDSDEHDHLHPRLAVGARRGLVLHQVVDDVAGGAPPSGADQTRGVSGGGGFVAAVVHHQGLSIGRMSTESMLHPWS